MANKTKLKKILSILAPDETFVDFKAFDEQVNTLKENLKKKIQVTTLDDVSGELEKFKKLINLSPLQDTLTSIEEKINADLTSKASELETLMSSKMDASEKDTISLEISDIQKQISEISNNRKVLKDLIDAKGGELQSLATSLSKRIETVAQNLALYIEQDAVSDKESTKSITDTVAKDIDSLRKEMMTRIGQLGGGSMNRQILIGGVNPLTRYTDINYKAGSNVTITYANNDTTKKVDITFSATGGSGSGIIRSITSVSVDTAVGSSTGTDYVYLVSGTTTMTLPDAVPNTNLYTIKNVGVGTVTLATTSAQTIDGQTSITMPVQFTSVDLISNGTNWNIT